MVSSWLAVHTNSTLDRVHAHVQVVIQEFPVLFRVQGFQQGRGRVALVRAADLVDLIQHDHRVGHLAVFQGLHEFTGHGTDVGAAVALDFGFIAHAAHAEPVKLPAQGIGYRTADGGFTHPRRAHQQQYGTTHFAFEGTFGQELDDTVFYIVQAVVVPVQNAAGFGQVEVVFGMHTPGHLGNPVQVVAGNAVFRGALFQHL